MAQSQNVRQLVGHLFRHEAGRMAAVLVRILGTNNLTIAEDIVQDTLMKAMDTWRFHGPPQNPQAWLYAVAKNKALDFLRSEKRHQKIESEIASALQSEWATAASVNQLFLETEIQDSQLRMMFACCHPSLTIESQITLILKILCGLSVHEIASAFLTNSETIQKRLTRAKEKLREEKIKLELPDSMDINTRLDAALKALYLLFNEGYYSSHSLENIREDLCFEAMRLAHLLNENPLMNLPKVRALLALMCFHVSRFGARSNEEGAMILLEDQDRQKWDQHLIKIGTELLEKASEGNLLSEYHVEASIAAVHAHADSFDQTDWKKILFLYDLLLELKSGPMVELNRAIAIGYAIHPKEGLNALIQIKEMKQNHLFYSAIANFENLCGNIGSAITNYETARQLAPTEKEKDFLKMKLTKLTSQSALA